MMDFGGWLQSQMLPTGVDRGEYDRKIGLSEHM